MEKKKLINVFQTGRWEMANKADNNRKLEREDIASTGAMVSFIE